MNTQKIDFCKRNLFCEQAPGYGGSVESMRLNWKDKDVTLDDEAFGRYEIKLMYHQALTTGELEPSLQN